MANQPQRRTDDSRINTLVTEVASIKKQVCANSKIVQEVRDILGSFRVIATAAKWITIVGAGAAVIYTTLHGAMTFFTHK